MHYLPQSRNLLADAVLTMTNMVGSTAIRRDSISRTGGGTVSLSGTYTGASDATFDIEITSATPAGDPTVSAPVFTGVGNGTMTSVTADPGTDPQTITVTLTDLGIPTRQAFAPFQSVTLRARLAGAHGNGITVTIDQSGLTRTASDYSITTEIRQGTAEYQGEEYNFGAPNLEPEGTVPTTAPRVSFGSDPQVYRHWRRFVGGRYIYHFSPTPVRDYPVGTPVYVVTGGRTVTIANNNGSTASAYATSTGYAIGDAVVPTTPAGLWYECTTAGTSGGTEPTWPTAAGATVTDGGVVWTCRGKITTSYTDIATLHDILSDIEADATALVEVAGVVANDRRPGGMACDDLTLFTASYAQDITADGTRYVREAQIGLTVASTAPTETLTVRCIQADAPGDEVWSVQGDISGALANATTGDTYTAGSYSFLIPARLPPAAAPNGQASVTLDLAPRGAEAAQPTACVRGIVLGANAREKEYVFVWQTRGGPDCPCSPNDVIGGPNEDYLGIVPEVAAMGTLAAEIVTPYTTVQSWENSFVKSQVTATATDGKLPMEASPPDGSNFHYVLTEKISSVLKIDTVDVDIAKRAAALWRNAIVDIHAQTDEWATATDTAFGTEWTDFTGFMTTGFGSNIGADFVQRIVDRVTFTNGGAESALLAQMISGGLPTDINAWIAEQGPRFLTTQVEGIIRRIKAQIGAVYVAAGLLNPFDDATAAGGGVWQDYQQDGWFVSRDGLLPLQPPYGYHSARALTGPDGEEIYESTGEFWLGVSIGCPENLIDGDELRVKVERVVNPRYTYQINDLITARIVRADPVPFGGGQTGDDTLTWRVVGSVDGPLADYALDTTAPVAYSDGGVGFLITPGAIDYALGDTYTWAVEGGVFRWRKNGGSWTSGVDIEPSVSLSDGLSAVFAAGSAPSFVAGDTYSFTALAVNGPDRLRTPDDRSARWTTSTIIEAAGAEPVDALLLWHDIPSTATVRLQGSDDGFSTTPFDRVLTWRRDWICALLASPVTYAEYRITVSQAGTIRWAWLGQGLQPALRNGLTEPGQLSQLQRLKRPGLARGRDVSIEHAGCTQASVDVLLAALEDAAESHDSIVGLALADGEGVTVRTGDVDLTDALLFQPTDPAHRLIGVRVQMSAP